MLRTHASLATVTRRALDALALPAGTVVLCATSGGPDSMALLHVLARLGRARGLRLTAHGVDHGLRPEAGAELEIAAALAKTLDVPFDRTRVRVPRGGNLQARARAMRWEALVAAARRQGAVIATAHHADDRAETVLLRLLRGAGLRGLGVLPPRAPAPAAPDVTVVRPFVRARREDVLLHLERHAIAHATDPSNDDVRYLRTRVRKLMPLLAAMDPRIVEHLAAVAEEAGHAEGATHTWVQGLPRATQEAIAALVRTGNRSARVWLPDGLVVMVDPTRSRASRRESEKSVTPLLVQRRRGI